MASAVISTGPKLMAYFVSKKEVIEGIVLSGMKVWTEE